MTLFMCGRGGLRVERVRTVLVCGSLRWTDAAPVRRVLSGLRREGYTVLLHGAAPGVDSLAGRAAEEMGFVVQPWPAEWGRHGRSAGPIRNGNMLRYGRPELVVALTDDLSRSRGTADMVRQARAAGVTVRVVPLSSSRLAADEGGVRSEV